MRTQPRRVAGDVLLMRLLVLLLIASCGVSEATAPKPSVSLETWLGRWKQARECMVYPAEDLRTGVAIPLLLGRDCSSDIEGLSEPAPDVPAWNAAVHLAASLPAATMPAGRSSLIHAIDQQLAVLGVTPPSSSAPELPRILGRPMSDIGGEVHSNVGVVLVQHTLFDMIATTLSLAPDARISVRPHTKYGVPTLPRGEWLVDDVSAVEGRSALGAIDDGRSRLIVLRGNDVAYRFLSSTDGGVSWTKGEAPNGTRLVSYSQDPINGALDVIVRDLDHIYLHHILAGNPPQIRVVLWEDKRKSWKPSVSFARAVDCQRDGVFWSLDDDRVRGLQLDGKQWEWGLQGSTKHAGIECVGRRALVTRRKPDVLELCEGVGCVRVFSSKSDRSGVATFRKDGSWIYATALEDLVAVWRPGRRVELFKLSAGSDLGALRAIADLDSLTLVMERGVGWFRDDY